MSTTQSTVIKVLSDVIARKGESLPTIDDKALNGSFEQFGLDSMDKLDFAMGLEDAIGTVFITSEILQCKTLAEGIIAFADGGTPN